mmetsp:Transcript_102052/g.288181  ORF Transcript_102052/g.288181 Transcript_102052/m.288181 type:complete len:88 (+) Transcript_102052:50-313(+)
MEIHKITEFVLMCIRVWDGTLWLDVQTRPKASSQLQQPELCEVYLWLMSEYPCEGAPETPATGAMSDVGVSIAGKATPCWTGDTAWY